MNNTKLYSEMTVEELLEDYHYYERKLYQMGKSYQDIPEGAFEKIEGWVKAKGYKLVHHSRGLSTVEKR